MLLDIPFICLYDFMDIYLYFSKKLFKKLFEFFHSLDVRFSSE